MTPARLVGNSEVDTIASILASISDVNRTPTMTVLRPFVRRRWRLVRQIASGTGVRPAIGSLIWVMRSMRFIC